MEFIDKLEEDQRDNAVRIAQEAKRMGINPRLAVALAYQESGLRMPQKPGSHGEIGIMQIKPATAEMIGFSREAIDNPEENIKAGLTYLKMGLDKFNDPVLAVAGYNAGHDHPYFTNPEKGLPETTKNYLKSIKGMGGFSEPEVQPEEPAVEKPGVEVSEQDLAAMKARGLTDVVGAATGAAAAKGLQIGSDVMETAKAMGANARAQAAAAQSAMAAGASGAPGAPGARPGGLPTSGGMAAPSAVGPSSLIPTDPMHTRQMQGTMEAGATGKARQTTYNVGTSQEAAKRRASEQILQQLQQRGAVAQTAEDILAKAPGLTSTPSGVLVPSSAVYPTAPSAPPAPQKMGALQKVAGAAKTGAGAVARSPVTMGALGGLGAAEAGQEFYSRYKAGDIPGMMISGVGAVGGLASVVPNPIVRGLGVTASGVSPLGLYLLDKMRGKIPAGAERAFVPEAGTMSYPAP